MTLSSRTQYRRFSSLRLLLTINTLVCGLLIGSPALAELDIPNVPLSVRVAAKPNIMLILDNSNSMDEDVDGYPVGSSDADSKSEIARSVARDLVTQYTSRINMGLMTYKQSGVSNRYLGPALYDASYDPANYDPDHNDGRASTKKWYRQLLENDSGHYVYYNVVLPYYLSSNNTDETFCYSETANARASTEYPDGFNNGETQYSGPWDYYKCYSSKSDTTDYSFDESFYEYTDYFYPTDTDYALNIYDFGAQLHIFPTTVRAYASTTTPGGGTVSEQIATLDSSKATSILKKLQCNVPGTPTGCSSSGIKNAGGTPLQGTLEDATSYFVNNASRLPESCDLDFAILLTDGYPTTDADGNTISDLSTALDDTATAAGELLDAGVSTYVVGFALPNSTVYSSVDLNGVAKAGGTDEAFDADNADELQNSLADIFQSIVSKTAASADVTITSGEISDDSFVYQAIFNSGDWSGNLIAYDISSGSEVQEWSASDNFPSNSDRSIWTYNPDSGISVEFKLASALTSDQQAALKTDTSTAQEVVDYLRGDQTQENQFGGSLRNRSSVLGDIVHSPPTLDSDNGVLYVGANDGMLHAFDSGTGTELFGFIPPSLISELSQLTSRIYGHDYFVDGESLLTDSSVTGGNKILITPLGRGGKSMFALDVTTPASFGSSNFLWEYNAADDGTYGDYIGYLLSQPIVGTLPDGNTRLIYANGYNNTKETAALIIANYLTGEIVQVINTGATGSNGLTDVTLFDSDDDGVYDYAYGGDLLGDLWKFDLSAGTAVRLFNGINTQPITAKPLVAVNDDSSDDNYGKRYVFFGSGRFVDESDPTKNLDQYFFGIIDDGSKTNITRSNLKKRSFDTYGTVSGYSVRTLDEAVDGDMSGKYGWYLVLDVDYERVVSEAILVAAVQDILEFSSIIPHLEDCEVTGSGYINQVDPWTGGATSAVIYDLNDDGLFNEDDMLDDAYVTSVDLGIGMPSAPVAATDPDSGNVLNVFSGSDAALTTVTKQGVGDSTSYNRRISWREIILD